MGEILRRCERFARSECPLLILGAPGTGKTVLAEHIHRLSGRRGRFVSEAAWSVPEQLERADRGTFFLDELGDASAQVQQILRQLLENKLTTGSGENPTSPDVRFIAATNADLGEMVRAGTFRRDLADRFGFGKIRLPCLAERRDEILPLADFFLQREARKVGMGRLSLSPAVRACLTAAPWDGNIRELESLCVYLSLQVDYPRQVELSDLPPDFMASQGKVLRRNYDRSEAMRRAREALARSNGNKTAAAALLGIHRRHIYRLLA